MMVLLDSPPSKPPFVLRKLKVKVLLKPVSGSRSNYNFPLKRIVRTIMFQFQPRKSKKKKWGGRERGCPQRITLSSIDGEGWELALPPKM